MRSPVIRARAVWEGPAGAPVSFPVPGGAEVVVAARLGARGGGTGP